jgi:hypothetical protein
MTSTLSSSARTHTRWLNVGRSDAADAREAGRSAVATALGGGVDAKVVLAYFSDSLDLPALAAGLHEAAGDVPVVGCSTAGEISTEGLSDHGVVAVAIGGPGLAVEVGHAVGVGADPRGTASEAAACITGVNHLPHRILMLLSEGLKGGQQDVVRGAYEVAGAEVPLVGACAGDHLKMQKTYQLVGGALLEDAVVAVALGSEAPIGVGVSHGWRKLGEPVVVSASTNSQVIQLDGEPALDVYLRRTNAPAAAYTDAEAFNHFAITHPLGVSRRSGEEVRLVAGADFETRALQFIAHVPAGGLAWFMEGDEGSVLRAADDACSDALAGLGDGACAGFLVFDCVARRGAIGDEAAGREVERIAGYAGGLPIAGFYSYGEIARTRGVTGFHNQTLVVVALS